MTKRGVRLIPVHTSLDEAEEMRRVRNSDDFQQSILSEEEFMGLNLPAREAILSGFVSVESINIINGFRGYGKSWLAMAIANEVTWGGSVGPWDVVKPVNVLMIDGEMPLNMLQERLKMLNRGRRRAMKKSELWLYPESYAYRIGLKRANLLEPAWRRKIQEQVREKEIKLLVLDNLSSLAPGIDENEKMAFDPVNRWLLEMRFSGVATVMTHHTGKSGEQRGTTAHEDHVDVSVLLRHPVGYKREEGCRFEWVPVKDRAHLTGGEAFEMELEAEEGTGRLRFASEGRKEEDGAVKMLLGHPAADTWEKAKAAGVKISRATFFRARKKAKEILERGGAE